MQVLASLLVEILYRLQDFKPVATTSAEKLFSVYLVCLQHTLHSALHSLTFSFHLKAMDSSTHIKANTLSSFLDGSSPLRPWCTKDKTFSFISINSPQMTITPVLIRNTLDLSASSGELKMHNFLQI